MLTAFCTEPTIDGLKILWSGTPSGGILDHYSIRGAQVLPIEWASPELGTSSGQDITLSGLGLHQKWYFKVFAVEADGDYFDATNTCLGITRDTLVPGVCNLSPEDHAYATDGLFTVTAMSNFPDAAQTFRIQVARDALFTQILVNEIVGPYDGPCNPSLILDVLRAGTYHWRIRRETPSISDYSDPWVIISYRPDSLITTTVAISDPVNLINEGTEEDPVYSILHWKTLMAIFRCGPVEQRLPFIIQIYDCGPVGAPAGEEIAAVIVPMLAPGIPYMESQMEPLLSPMTTFDMNTYDRWTSRVNSSSGDTFWRAFAILEPEVGHRYRLRVIGMPYGIYPILILSEVYKNAYGTLPGGCVVESEDIVFTLYGKDDIIQVGVDFE